MRKSVCFCLLICMLSVLIGCGGSVPKESTIAVDKKGKITDTIVEEFDKDFYDSEELQGEIESELAEYNKNYATDHITMKKFEVKDGTATLQLVFDGSEYYEDYTETTLFNGTVAEAQAGSVHYLTHESLRKIARVCNASALLHNRGGSAGGLSPLFNA